jgi:hypothetical protein
VTDRIDGGLGTAIDVNADEGATTTNIPVEPAVPPVLAGS